MNDLRINDEGSDGIREDVNAWRGALDLPRPASVMRYPGAGESAPVDFWLAFMLPSYNQQGPSCVGQAWANWIEAMVRYYINPLGIPKGYQIDGEAIWRRGRQMFWQGDMSGGLYLPQGFQAARDLGWIPADARLVSVAQDWDSINNALESFPLVQGHMINAGWFRADPDSGCIDHEAPADGTGGHATLLAATLRQVDTSGNLTRWRVFLNSWGANRGRFGFFTMTEKTWLAQVMQDGPYTAEIPDFSAWTSWKKGLAIK